MAQGNFLQSLLNRQPQMQPMIRPEDLPAYQAEQAKIAEQRAKHTLMNGLRNLVQDPTSALFGKQSPVQEQPIIGVDMTQQDYNNLQQQGLVPQISMGAAQNPRTGGLLNDIASGFRENVSTPFAVSNLEPQQNKGFATRLGEGLGSAARFADSPLGRMALTAGVVGATGGSGLQALTYGATAGVGNQNLRTQDQFYRNQLQGEGIDTSNIQGYVTPEMYKNYSMGKYRQQMIEAMQQKQQGTQGGKVLTVGQLMMLSPEFKALMQGQYDFSGGQNAELLNQQIPSSLLQGFMPAKKTNINYTGGLKSSKTSNATINRGGGTGGGSKKPRLIFEDK